MRRPPALPRWLLALAGATTAHAVTYLIVHGLRHGEDVIGIHGFRPGLAAGLLALSVLALVARGPGTQTGGARTVAAALPWQLGAYLALLMVEWSGTGVVGSTVLHDPWLWVGMAVNGLVAVILAGVSHVVVAATAACEGPDLGHGVRSPIQRWQPLAVVAPASAGMVASGGSRAPPVD